MAFPFSRLSYPHSLCQGARCRLGACSAQGLVEPVEESVTAKESAQDVTSGVGLGVLQEQEI